MCLFCCKDRSFEATIKFDARSVNIWTISILRKVNNEWMLHNMKMVSFEKVEMKEFVRKTPHGTKIILQKLLYDTNCTFHMACLKDVTTFFSHYNFKINDEKGVSLSVDSYRNEQRTKHFKTKQANICKKVTKLQIKNNTWVSMDTMDLFENVTQLEMFASEPSNFNPEEPKFNLYNFPKLKDLSLVLEGHEGSTIHIPKQIETLKIDQIYCETNDGLPIVIDNDSVLHTMEIHVSIGNDYTEMEINNFVEILNLCNKLNHFKCLKINVNLHFDQFSEKMQDPINSDRIEKWKHNEKRTIIVTFMVAEDHSTSSIENKMQALFKQLFANNVRLVCQTKTTEPPNKRDYEPNYEPIPLPWEWSPSPGLDILEIPDDSTQ